MLDKWKKINRTKKILSMLTIGFILIVCLTSAIYASNLDDLKLPDDFKEDASTSIYKHTLFGDVMQLRSSSTNETVKQYGDVELRIQEYDDSTPDPVKVSDDPFYKYDSNRGYWELVDINGEKFEVGISNSQTSLHDGAFSAYCFDKLKEFNKLNDAKIIEA
ncbi:TPA: hypothetical protein vir323_00035 [Caudoviricetes sp. vir323]|uniref:Uncharacterized protein n=1 Tax=Caudoviricetes sp. vir323 TaxID=3068356 RepID=A0AA86XTF2_9CAUD|nr:TPA_asm: hypothetical protein vir323_00035 [Caudoviricetes sp. vir323]